MGIIEHSTNSSNPKGIEIGLELQSSLCQKPYNIVFHLKSSGWFDLFTIHIIHEKVGVIG